MIFGEQYRSYSSKLWSLLLYPVTLSPFYTQWSKNLTQHNYNPWRFFKNIPGYFYYIIMLLYMVATCYKTQKCILFYILFIMHPSDLLHHSLLDNPIPQITLDVQMECKAMSPSNPPYPDTDRPLFLVLSVVLHFWQYLWTSYPHPNPQTYV